jgi:murein DD-endopeptidase MepM/ murein hydrolase activator NlpD
MKRKLYILILLIILGGAFSFVYTNSIATINEQNFKVMRVQSFEDDRVDQYELPETSVASLFEVLTSLETEASTDSVDHVYEFDMVLTNRWGVSWEYRVLYDDDMTVYLQHDGSVYKIDEPEFFYSHEWFSDIYNDRNAPEIQILMNEKDVQLELDKSWDLLRYDGEWASQQSPGVISGGEEDVLIVSIDDSIMVVTEKEPDRSRLIIRNGSTENVVFDGDVGIDPLPYLRSNGHYDYELTMEWNDEEKPYQGQYVVNFAIILDLPEILEFSKQEVIQGDILEVVYYNVTSSEDIYFEQSIFKDFNWYVEDDMLRGYIPTNYNTKAGVYEVKYGNRETGTETIEEIEVMAHDYRIQYMYISESIQQATRNEEAYAEFAKYFTPVRKVSAPQRYYTESFVIPAKGRLTTEFGQTRYVNDAPTSYRHSGLDIGAPTGTEIGATNRGKVVLAMPLILTGNSLVIDHGEGLFSVYYHMDEIFVEKGEIVERGQLIAAVGTTGFSTGPHLHFTMSYYTMNIEPGFFLVGEPITFANYREFFE